MCRSHHLSLLITRPHLPYGEIVGGITGDVMGYGVCECVWA